MGFYATTEVKDENRCSPVFRTHKSENRLTKTESLSSVPDEFKVCVENEYDYMGRRFRKTVKDDYAGGSYSTTNVTTYIWDGWNIIAEMCDAGYTNFNTWGIDASGTLQGAGGVGGLIAVTRVDDTGTNSYFPCFDGNGNVCQYIDENGSVVAAREYSPFGMTIALTGDKKDDFTHWWSTKPWDAKTGISEYEHRPYIPSLGRFGSRDPLGYGGVSFNAALSSGDEDFADFLVDDDEPVYVFVFNDPINSVDHLGLYTLKGANYEWYKTHTCKGLSGKKLSKCQKALWKGSSDKSHFMIWYYMEKAQGAWWSSLPKCPKTICIISYHKQVVPSNVSGLGGWPTTKLFFKAENPDPSKWKNPKRPGYAELSLHPKAHWSMRSKPDGKGHANQCTYDAGGTLLTTYPSAGTVDWYRSGTLTHKRHDVEPIWLANELDGGKKMSLSPTTPSIKSTPGYHMKLYYEVRPLH